MSLYATRGLIPKHMDLGQHWPFEMKAQLHLVLTLAQNKISHTHFNSAALFEGSPRKSCAHYETACHAASSIESSFSESSIYRVKTEGEFKSAH